jgi:ABC-type branched-subunit amino acid transport system substrate-binding protein
MWLVSAVVLALLGLAACAPAPVEQVGQPQGEAAQPAAEQAGEAETAAEPAQEAEAPAEADVIKIGALAPLSAPGSVTGGEAMKAAFQIALEEINAEGGVLGKPVELVLVDTEGLPERGTAAMEKLISQDGVVAVVGEYHSAVGLAEKEVAKNKHIPIVFAETWNDDITASGYAEVFRIAPMSSEVASVDAQFISSLGIKKVVIMTENTGYGIPAAESTTERLAEFGIEAVTFNADLGTQDFSSIIERIKAEEPEMILVLLTGETSYNFEQQAAEAGIGPQDLPMICNQVAGDSEAYWTNVPDGNLCFYRRIGLPKALFTEQTKAFAAKYTALTGKAETESYAMEAYDSLKLMAQAINEAGSTDPDAIIEALENLEYDGALGHITFPINSKNPPEAAGKEPKWWHQFPNPAITMVQYQEPNQSAADAVVVFPEVYKTGEPILP